MFLKQTVEAIFSKNLSSCRRMFYKRKDEQKVGWVFLCMQTQCWDFMLG